MIIKTFDISTRFLTYPAKFVAPIWAQGFECKSGLCGLCCLTQLQPDTPQIHNANLDKAICRFYHTRNRICQKYENRPVTCKMYPFSFGVEDGQIVVSASLECPGTSLGAPLKKNVISDILKEPGVDRMITYMNDCYEKAVLVPHIWARADQMWKTLTHKVQDYFDHKVCFPFLLEVVQLIRTTVSELIERKTPKRVTISVATSVKNTEGLYIATRFESCNLGLVKVKGSKIVMTLFDDKLEKVKRVKIKTPRKFSDLEIEKSAQGLLSDYVSFLCNRPFLSLGAIIANIEHVPVSVSLMRTLGGSFVPIEVGATLVAHRDNLESIDRDVMREIISFSEGTTHSTFTNPANVHRY